MDADVDVDGLFRRHRLHFIPNFAIPTQFFT